MTGAAAISVLSIRGYRRRVCGATNKAANSLLIRYEQTQRRRAEAHEFGWQSFFSCHGIDAYRCIQAAPQTFHQHGVFEQAKTAGTIVSALRSPDWHGHDSGRKVRQAAEIRIKPLKVGEHLSSGSPYGGK